MSTPTFNPGGGAEDLTTSGEHVVLGSPRSRTSYVGVPGVDGAYATLLGQGPRTFRGSGFLNVTGASAALALVALKQDIIALQAIVGQSGTFVDTDGQSYSNCILELWQPGRTQHGPNNEARCRVMFAVVQLDPTDA